MGADYKQIISQARTAQKMWSALPVSARAQWLKKFQKYLWINKERIVEAIQADTRKPSAEAVGIELATVLMTADYYRKNAVKFLKEKKTKTDWMFKNKKVTVRRVPYGVVGILGPSNLPFSLTIGDAIPALMAGNAVIIKPSEWTPKAAVVGANLALESGLPLHLLQIMEGGAEIGEQLIENVDSIFFTGSTPVGRKVAMKAAELLKPCILELGGKAPMIVLENANLDRAARAAVWGRFAHSGQHCIAVERIYVDKKIAESFTQKVVALTKKLTPNELSPSTLPNGPKHIEGLVADAVQKGAAIAYQKVEDTCRGRVRTALLGCPVGLDWSPTVLVGVDHTMLVMKEESFGPLLPIMTFDSIEQAIALANDSESGLSAIIFTRDKAKAESLAKQIESGNVSINDVMDHFMIMDAPFAGWKQSGLGQRHSQEGLLQFTKPQTIFDHRWPLPFCSKKEFWWFPYRKTTERLLHFLLKLFYV